MTSNPQRKPPSELVGKVVSKKYRLRKLIGIDHLGALYDAEDIKIRKPVAIKALSPGVRIGIWDATGIKHPNVVKVHQFLDLGGDYQFVITDALPGRSLAATLKAARRLKPGEAVAVVMQILAALHALHGSGLVHGALSPETIFLGRDDEDHLLVRVLFLGSTTKCEPPEIPFYFSPEQDLGEVEIDQRADIWAVGVLLFEMLFGRRPFAGRNRDEISSKILLKPPVFPEGASVPEDLKPIIEQALAKEADDRYQNTTQMLGDLLPIHEELGEELDRDSEAAVRDSLVPPPASRPVPSPTDVEGGGQREELGAFEYPFAEEGPPSVKPVLIKPPKPPEPEAKPKAPLVQPAKPTARKRQKTMELRVFAPPVDKQEQPPPPEQTAAPVKAEPKPAIHPGAPPKAEQPVHAPQKAEAPAEVEERPKLKSRPPPKFEPKPKLKPKPKPKPKLTQKLKPKPAPRAEPKPVPKAEPKPPPKVEPKPPPRAEPKPPPRAEPKPPPRAEPKPPPRAEPRKEAVPPPVVPVALPEPIPSPLPAEEAVEVAAIDVAPPPLAGLDLDTATTAPLKRDRGELGLGEWVSRNRKPVIIVGASVAAVCLLIVLIVALTGGDEELEVGEGRPPVEVADLGGAPEAESTPEPAVEQVEEPAAEAAEEKPVEAAEEPAAEEPAEVTVAIAGLPEDARVTVGDRDAEPPLTLARSDEPVAIAVRATGYEDYETEVVPDRDRELRVSMKKIEEPEEEPEPAAGAPAAGGKVAQAWGGASFTSQPVPEPEPEPEPEEQPKKKKKNVWATNPF